MRNKLKSGLIVFVAITLWLAGFASPLPEISAAEANSGASCAPIVTYGGREWKPTSIDKRWSFESSGNPWNGINATWENNPHNAANPALAITIGDASTAYKSAVGSLGFTSSELAEFMNKPDRLVRVQFRRWQPEGWGGGQGTRIYWSTNSTAGVQWTDGSADTVSNTQKNGDLETFYYYGTDSRFQPKNGGTINDIRFEIQALNFAGKQPSGTKVFFDDISITVLEPSDGSDSALWRIGKNDGSSAEFSNYKAQPAPFSIPSDWKAKTDWTSVSKGLNASVNPTLSVSFTLNEVPCEGAELHFRILDAYRSIPQMAVFSNQIMAGLIQIAGINGSGAVDLAGKPLAYKNTYRLFIPPSLLQKGTNTIKLEAYGGHLADSTGGPYLWWVWDYLQLDALQRPAVEPIHGRYVHLGTNMLNNFAYNEDVIRQYPQLTKWMGIAYSGNWMRVGFWSDTQSKWRPHARPVLETMKQLNLTPLVDIFGSNITKDPDIAAGNVPPWVKQYYEKFITDFGDLFQYVEVDNEPGGYNHSLAGTVALAKFLKEHRDSPGGKMNLKIVAPGWSYNEKNGIPAGWERDPKSRRQVEDYADLTNGHSYGTTGVGALGKRGGALIENLLTYDNYTGDGLRKEMVMSETGANDTHFDGDPRFGTHSGGNKYKAIFDRELRSNIGYADHIMQHAAFYTDSSRVSYSLFKPTVDWNILQPEQVVAWQNVNEANDYRLATFRRLAIAYATHGRPLAYDYVNRTGVADKKVYFRAVDTSALPASAVGAKADKVLLNFVNFDKTTQTMQVRVTMPQSGTYVGERFGPETSYVSAYSKVTLQANPAVLLTETLQPGEAVQYILNESAPNNAVTVTTPPAAVP